MSPQSTDGTQWPSEDLRNREPFVRVYEVIEDKTPILPVALLKKNHDAPRSIRETMRRAKRGKRP